MHSPRLVLMALSLFASLPMAQETKPETAEEVIRRYEKGLMSIDGVREIVAEQIKGVTTISIRVEAVKARDTVALQTGGKLGTFPVRIVVSDVPFSTTPTNDSPKAPELACTHCPLHCNGPGARMTVVESKTEEPKTTAPESPQEQCDVARKWMGLPKRKSTSGSPCEEMVSWSDSAEKIRWVITKHVPHWRSQEMGGLRGSDKNGVDCPEHGKHPVGEIICYTWIKHNPSCPLESRVAPMDILQPGTRKADR